MVSPPKSPAPEPDSEETMSCGSSVEVMNVNVPEEEAEIIDDRFIQEYLDKLQTGQGQFGYHGNYNFIQGYLDKLQTGQGQFRYCGNEKIIVGFAGRIAKLFWPK